MNTNKQESLTKAFAEAKSRIAETRARLADKLGTEVITGEDRLTRVELDLARARADVLAETNNAALLAVQHLAVEYAELRAANAELKAVNALASNVLEAMKTGGTLKSQSQRRGRGKNPLTKDRQLLFRLRDKVRKLADQGITTAAAICRAMDAAHEPLPPDTEWENEPSWCAALRGFHKGAVRTWISRNRALRITR
jgi:hypothetical protein